MIIVVWTIASLLATFIADFNQGLDGAPAQKSPQAHFPVVQASNFEKRAFNLPADFEGKRDLLLVAFQREQPKDVDTWLREMKRFEEVDRDFHYYELATIQEPNALARWFIDTGMRRGIPDRKARGRTITLYLDKKLFSDALLITDQKKVYQFLVDRNGKVVWQSQELFDETKGANSRGALGGLRRG